MKIFLDKWKVSKHPPKALLGLFSLATAKPTVEYFLHCKGGKTEALLAIVKFFSILTIPFLISFAGSSTLATTARGVFRVQTQCARCLRIIDQNFNDTGQRIPKNTLVQTVGPINNGYYPVLFSQSGRQVVYYLHSTYLAPYGTVRPAPTTTTPRDEAPAPVTATTTPVTERPGTNYPASGNEDQRRAWVFNQLRYWVSFSGNNLINSNPQDMNQFCPNYSSLNREQKVDLWATLMTRVSYFESEYDTRETHTESFRDSSGARVISTGLFQLSRESARGYGCPMNNQEDLMDPVKNTQCAVTIMNRWVGRDNLVGRGSRGGGRYWAVFRGTREYTRLARASIIDSARSYCASVDGPGSGDNGVLVGV